MPYVLNLKSGLQCGVHQNDIFPLSKLHGRLYDIKLWHFWDLLPMTPASTKIVTCNKSYFITSAHAMPFW